ncbi:expansin-B14 [Artemisia annua]|uniref:Expansin-B14 n=1 Tax=Artemisia annua TaxID=35608 RepID=A0A2U1L1E3_ARTAN|nr:expansin-B14 [Artemisia annua]
MPIHYKKIHNDKSAQGFLFTIPIDGLGQRMDHRQFRSVLCYRLYVPMFSEGSLFPSCNVHRMDQWGDHVVHCSSEVGMKFRHNLVRNILVHICSKVGIIVRKEAPMGFLSEDGKELRPADLLLFNWLQGHKLPTEARILCTQEPYCSGKPITVTISDECPGLCNTVPFHFDLSGFAFGAMAYPGQDHNLRQLGQVDVQYQRVPCSYGGTNIAFKVSEKVNPSWFSMAIEYADGDGGFKHVEIAQGGTKNFVAMDNIWGAVWKVDVDPSFQPPFSFRLTSADGKTVVANNVIPENFSLGQKYSSNVNFA